MTQTNPHPEQQLSACCNAPVVLCEGNAWDVPLSTLRAGSTYFYGCTKCREACGLSSTDSPETYSAGSGAAVEPDELDVAICVQCGHLEDNHKWYPQDEEHWGGEEHWECRNDGCVCAVDWSEHNFVLLPQEAKIRLLAWRQQAVDAAYQNGYDDRSLEADHELEEAVDAAVAAALQQQLDEILEWSKFGARHRLGESGRRAIADLHEYRSEQLKNKDNT